MEKVFNLKYVIKKIKEIWNKIRNLWNLFDKAHRDTLLGRISLVVAGGLGSLGLMIINSKIKSFPEFFNFNLTERVSENITIFIFGLPLIFVLWLLRTNDSLKRIHEKPYFEGLGALVKDDKYSKKLAFKLLLPLKKKGVYKKEIKDIFSGMDLSGVDLSNMDLRELNFEKTNFTNTILKNCNLSNLDFSKSILSNTNFENSILINTNFSESNLENSILINTNLNEAKGINMNKGNFLKIKGASLAGMDIKSFGGRIVNLKRNDLGEAKKMFTGVFYNDSDNQIFWETEYSSGDINYRNEVEDEIKKVMIKINN